MQPEVKNDLIKITDPYDGGETLSNAYLLKANCRFNLYHIAYM